MFVVYLGPPNRLGEAKSKLTDFFFLFSVVCVIFILFYLFKFFINI